jgi:hypothetical protein
VFVLATTFGAVAGADAASIKAVRLQLGRQPYNTISAPLFKADGVAPLRFRFTADYAGKGKTKIMRGFGNMFTKGPSYDLEPVVDLATLFQEAARDEAKAMGFSVAEASGAAWEVTGSVKDIYMESQQMTGYGAMLSWGYMLVDFDVKAPGGATEHRTWRFHSFVGKMPGGFSRKDEAEAALANLLVEGAQELTTRLNRELFKAPALAHVEQKLQDVVAGGVKGREGHLHLVGLAAGSSAVAPLLGRLVKEESEDERSKIINALARIGSADAVAPLVERYLKEDEDCRWYSLKAMDYIGGEAAKALIQKGASDSEEPCKRLAKRLLG